MEAGSSKQPLIASVNKDMVLQVAQVVLKGLATMVEISSCFLVIMCRTHYMYQELVSAPCK